MINSGKYRLYDYGLVKNMKKYGLAEPPHVAIENYSIPTALISGDVDTLAVPADVQWIKEQLGDNVVFA